MGWQAGNRRGECGTPINSIERASGRAIGCLHSNRHTECWFEVRKTSWWAARYRLRQDAPRLTGQTIKSSRWGRDQRAVVDLVGDLWRNGRCRAVGRQSAGQCLAVGPSESIPRGERSARVAGISRASQVPTPDKTISPLPRDDVAARNVAAMRKGLGWRRPATLGVATEGRHRVQRACGRRKNIAAGKSAFCATMNNR
jgi:hypothetical protein